MAKPHPTKMVTLSQIAAETGLSVTAVSYALRGNSKIPPKTQKMVKEAARKLGYRPNPRIASLMSQIRGGVHASLGEQIAFLWVHTSPEEVKGDPFLQKIFQGACHRAEQLGFTLDELWTTAPGMTEHRLEDVIQARGIVGVILSPLMTDEESVSLDWHWDRFSVAAIGNVPWKPELHHVGHHHYLGMQMALMELKKKGFHMPGAILSSVVNERAHRAWEASFLVHHPLRASASRLLHLEADSSLSITADWLKASKADSLIVSNPSLLNIPNLRQTCRNLQIPIVTLHWMGEDPDLIGGVDQCEERIATHAVDIVATQLNHNETGAPDLPARMLFPGRWVAPIG